KEWEEVSIPEGRVQHNAVAARIGVEGMHHATLRPFEPADILAVPGAGKNANVPWLGVIPAPMDLALLQTLETGHIAAHRDDEVLLGASHVVKHRNIRRPGSDLVRD